MKIQLTTDYAIRIILYMAQQGTQESTSTAKETAKQLGITYSYFNKMAAIMKKAGFLESVQGMRGGYRLAKPAADINLYDIVRTMQGDIQINRCLEDDGFCSRNATQICKVHKIFGSLQSQMIDTLKGIGIHDLCK